MHYPPTCDAFPFLPSQILKKITDFVKFKCFHSKLQMGVKRLTMLCGREWWHTLSFVNHIDTTQLHASVSSCIMKSADNDFFWMCYAAPWHCRGHSLKNACCRLHMSRHKCALAHTIAIFFVVIWYGGAGWWVGTGRWVKKRKIKPLQPFPSVFIYCLDTACTETSGHECRKEGFLNWQASRNTILGLWSIISFSTLPDIHQRPVFIYAWFMTANMWGEWLIEIALNSTSTIILIKNLQFIASWMSKLRHTCV